MADLDPGLVAKALYGRRWDVLASTGADVSVIDTWDARLSRDKRILVPVDVQAFVAPPADGEPVVAVGGVPGDPAPFDPGGPAAPGVHLHWAMPDALLAATRDPATDDPVWPVLPDRWVVIRHLYPSEARTVVTTGWVLDAATAVVTPLADYRGLPTSSAPEDQFVPLDGVRGGSPMWTATYAASRQRFAFHDPLDDLPQLRAAHPKGFDRDLATYTVAGWWSSDGDDPLSTARGSHSLTTVATRLGWNITGDASDADDTPPDPKVAQARRAKGLRAPSSSPTVRTVTKYADATVRDDVSVIGGLPAKDLAEIIVGGGATRYHTMVHGSVLGVPLGGPAGRDERPDEEALGAALGLDIDDVAAAFGAPGLGLGADRRQFAERLLAAFTAGTLTDLASPDGLADLEEREHADGFWSFVGAPLPNTHDDVLREAGSSAFSPEKVGRAGRSDAARAQLEEVVIDWREEVRVRDGDARGTRKIRRTRTKGVTGPAPVTTTGRTVSKSPPRLFRPAPLVVGIRGVRPHQRHHGDGLHQDGALLRCRRPAEVIPGIRGVVEGASILPSLGSGAVPPEVLLVAREASLIDGYHAAWLSRAGAPGVPVAAAYERLRAEMLRLHGADATYDGTGAGLAHQIAKSGVQAPKEGWGATTVHERRLGLDIAAQLADFSLLPGTPPSPVAVTTWRQPWVPLFVEWEVELVGSDRIDGWTLGTTDLEGAPAAATVTRTASGRAPLHRAVGELLTTQMGAWLAAEQARDTTSSGELDATDQQGLTSLANLLRPIDLASASLDGVREQLLGIVDDGLVQRDPDTELPIADALPTPLFGGTAQVTRLRLVDAFGRTRDVPLGAVATTLPLDTGTPGTVRLRPRVQHAARWLFRLVDPAHPVSADPAAALEAWVDQLHPELAVNPVCGFLLPDHMDESCEVFDRDGTPVGEVLHDSVTDAVTWEPAPGRPVPPDAGPMVDLPAHAQHVGRLADGLVRADIAARHATDHDGGEDASALTAMLRAIDTTLWSVDAYAALGTPTVAGLVGRPIAVVRATLRLDLPDDLTEVTITEAGGAPARRAAYEAMREVRFPVRIGELGRSDDAVLGFYVDDDYAHLHLVDKVVAGVARESGRHQGHLGLLGAVETPARKPLDHPYLTLEDTLWLRPGETTRLTVLVLPGGKIHLTTGITPRKHLALADDWVTPGLKVLSPSLRVGPVLVDPAEVRLPKVAAFGTDQVFTRRTGPLTWRDDPIIAASSAAMLPPMPHEAQEGWIRVAPVRPPASAPPTGAGA
jgi:hypothetical protein